MENSCFSILLLNSPWQGPLPPAWGSWRQGGTFVEGPVCSDVHHCRWFPYIPRWSKVQPLHLCHSEPENKSNDVILKFTITVKYVLKCFWKLLTYGKNGINKQETVWKLFRITLKSISQYLSLKRTIKLYHLPIEDVTFHLPCAVIFSVGVRPCWEVPCT